MPPIARSLAFLLIPLGVCAACLNLSKEYPQKSRFALEARRGAAATPTREAPVLQVRRFDASSAYGSVRFVYRTSDNEYEADFYNEFFASSSALVTDEVARWMSDSGLFQVTVGVGSGLTPELVLDGSLRSIHGDLRDEDAPRAVLDLQLFLSRVEPGGAVLVFHRDYRADPQVPDASAAAMAAGWNEALQTILVRLESDLRDVLDS